MIEIVYSFNIDHNFHNQIPRGNKHGIYCLFVKY